MNTLTNTILMVDDSEDDVFALKRAMRKAHIANPQQVVTDGQTAIDYLSGSGKYSDRARFPLPFLVFLDLRIPCRDGFEVLGWVREQPGLNELAVVILTGSVAEKDDRQACRLGAHSYLMKPPTASDLERLMQPMEQHWVHPENAPADAARRH